MPISFGSSAFLFSDSAGIYSESSAYSVAIWLLCPATTVTRTFYGEASRSSGTPIFSLQTSSSSGKASVFLRNNAGTIGILNVTTAATVFDGTTWHHFGYAQDASGNWQVYVDGAADSNCHGSFTPGAISVPTLGIGCLRQNPTTQQFTNGSAGHPATWNRRLATQEFASLAAGMPPSLLGPTHNWPLWISEPTLADIGSTRLSSALAPANSPTTTAGGPPISLYVIKRNIGAPHKATSSVVTGAATLTGTGSSTVAGSHTAYGAAALTGAGSATVAGVRTRLGAATLTGAGSLASAGFQTAAGTVSITGLGSLTANGFQTAAGAADLAGTGSLSATGGHVLFGTSTLAGTGTITVAGTTVRVGISALTGLGSMTVAGTVTAAPHVIDGDILEGFIDRPLSGQIGRTTPGRIDTTTRGRIA